MSNNIPLNELKEGLKYHTSNKNGLLLSICDKFKLDIKKIVNLTITLENIKEYYKGKENINRFLVNEMLFLFRGIKDEGYDFIEEGNKSIGEVNELYGVSYTILQNTVELITSEIESVIAGHDNPYIRDIEELTGIKEINEESIGILLEKM